MQMNSTKASTRIVVEYQDTFDNEEVMDKIDVANQMNKRLSVYVLK